MSELRNSFLKRHKLFPLAILAGLFNQVNGEKVDLEPLTFISNNVKEYNFAINVALVIPWKGS